MEASLVRAAARHALRIARCNCGEKGKGGGGRKASGRISSRCVSRSTSLPAANAAGSAVPTRNDILRPALQL